MRKPRPYQEFSGGIAICYSPMMQAWLVLWGPHDRPVWDRHVLRIFTDRNDAIYYVTAELGSEASDV